MNYKQTPEWKALELKPFNLAGVPSGLEWCIYPEEKARGEVLCPQSVYMIVLALRWILSCTNIGLEEEFETWKVYWKCEDEYGFKNRIFLFREKVEQYDSYDGEYHVLQPQTWMELAKLYCREGKGIIKDVFMAAGQPYTSTTRLDGQMGVRRLLEDAILGSEANHNYYPFQSNGEYTCTMRVGGPGQAEGDTLGFKLEGDFHWVHTVDLKVW